MKTNWTGGNAFVHTDANRLESNLALLKTMAENVKDALLYCGTFACGSGNIEL
jgi:signal-transduction protein with cAMP-binding, CBS, and nucleotidyltransferase domain